jgi:Pyruvate/2-oxoacid:ferredoxin oxidoreductase delta subunit
MNISRKDFFRKSLFSLGDTFLKVKDSLNGAGTAQSPQREERDFVPLDQGDLLAVAYNERCLAKNCGCIACFERCEPQAILVVMGQGIRIDASRCNGCGACEYVCPVTPKAVVLEPRS